MSNRLIHPTQTSLSISTGASFSTPQLSLVLVGCLHLGEDKPLLQLGEDDPDGPSAQGPETMSPISGVGSIPGGG